MKITLYGLLLLIALLALIVSCLFISLAVYMYFLDKNNAMVVLGFSSFFALLMALLSRKLRIHRRFLINDQVDNLILKLAMKHSGLITATELASVTELSLKGATLHLERNVNEGYCTKKTTKNGGVDVYHFAGAVSTEEKLQSISALG